MGVPSSNFGGRTISLVGGRVDTLVLGTRFCRFESYTRYKWLYGATGRHNGLKPHTVKVRILLELQQGEVTEMDYCASLEN